MSICIQLFYQPSLTASYLRNNRFMSAYDFTLAFPSIPLSFGISSDLAAGWSKLVYEQVLMNKTQQKIEVEIQGLTDKEAFVVEQCVKLLFGFKIEFCIPDLWQALKVCDIIGITQSPQVEGITVQEQLLQFAFSNIQQVNLIEGLDYTLQLLEVGGEGLLVHRSDIRQLCTVISEKIKQIIIDSKFEVLSNYAHSQDQSVDSQTNTKFLIKDLKREHYIQLRTLFYNFVNQQNTELTANQCIVKVLFEELDQQFELDSYINKYFEEVTAKMQAIDTFINSIDKKYETQLNQLNETVNKEFDALKKENKFLKNQLYFAHQRIEALQNPILVCQWQANIFCYSNGIVKLDNGVLHTENLENDSITCVRRTKDQILIGMQGGNILCYNKQLEKLPTLKANAGKVNCLHIYNNYLLCGYSEKYGIWWNQQLILQEALDSAVCNIYSNAALGNFIVLGTIDGTIEFIYINESKPQLMADHIKKLRNSSSAVLKFDIIPKQNDLLVSGHADSLICIWNWELENMLSVIKLDQQLIDFQITPSDQYTIRVLLENGQLQEYSNTQQHPIIQSIFIDNKPLQLLNDECITKDGKLHKLRNGPINCSNYHLQHQSTYYHHQDTCVYGLLLINYPYVASSADDKSIVIFNLKSQEKLILRGHQSYIRAIGLLQENKHIISGSYDTSIKVWEIATGVCINTLNGHTKPVLCIQVLYQSAYTCVSGGEDGVMRAWNWKSGTCIWKVESKSEIWSLLAIQEHCTILSGNKDGMIKVFNTGNGDKSQMIGELKVHKQHVNCIIQLKGSIIASGSSDTTIQITNFYTGENIRTLNGHQNIVWSLQIIDDETIASSSTEGKIKIWNWKQSQCLNSQVVGKGSIYVLLKLPHTHKLIGGTAQGEILSWKICREQYKQI